MHKLINSYNAFIKTLEEYNIFIETQYKNKIPSESDTGIFANIKNNHLEVIKNLAIPVVILQKNLIKYKIDVLGIYSSKFPLNSIEDKLRLTYPEYANDRSYKLWDEAIGSIKHNSPNIYCWLCIKKEQLITTFSKFFNWFHKPQNCSKKEKLIIKKTKIIIVKYNYVRM